MKKYLVSFALSALMLNANEIVFEEGFSGKISVGGGFRDVKSNLSPLADSDFLGSYNAKNSDTSAIPLVGFELYYGGLIENDRVFLKNYNGRDLSGFALGYEMAYMSNFSSSLSFVSSIREKAYANPYALNTFREETDLDKFGLKFSQVYQSDFGKFGANYLFAKNKYDKETIPYSSLKRDGFYHEFELNYDYSLFNAGLLYDYNDADGKAASFSRYGFKAGLNLPLQDDFIISPTIAYSYYEADGTDPIFNKKQDGDIFELGVNVVKNKLLGYESLYAYANYNLEKRDSDINFYDETYQIFLTGLGYKF
ncbi:DUF2860 family protein [Campylobacter helveticus]|uniref:DUF2860 domain-containing protein n=2 Tax=Campylobacter helveticus TaxID=28898 RepID=A0AAX2UI02_9BACT|nr:DUF2860 family protein [Campylobacter helveticus]ARE80237.1 hypothetical protein (DUF2860 domain) [Campylobacter helveticus]MCR2040464.1 DUF2860 domain-containing protein [Campylobacter helveticus]MCR2055196.1 DUF2860 domain-containing protein [Campylobacter helveticus]MCR2056687.1 DUF2860 domain-containing protein [Campylobacter helveticus]MCR2060509.1 DUF2860 domain-containing protein [Campylobacter helveticus]